jgi:hypothetical protein
MTVVNVLIKGVWDEATQQFISPIDAAMEGAQITARPGSSVTAKADENDEIGKYYNGISYANASSDRFGPGNVFHEAVCAVVNSGDYRKDRLVSMYFKGSKPAPKASLAGFVLYKENTSDDGKAVQDGVTYFKYVADLT